MGVYLRAKFEVSSIILTSFRLERGWGDFTPPHYPPASSKRTPKKPTQIRVKWKSHLRAEIFGPNIAPIQSKSQRNQYEF